MAITCTLRSSDPELNGQPVDILEYGADGKCLVSLRDCPRLAFWYDRSAIQLEQSKCKCGKPTDYFSELFNQYLCNECRNTVSTQVYPQ
jgi:hypothetical protein